MQVDGDACRSAIHRALQAPPPLHLSRLRQPVQQPEASFVRFPAVPRIGLAGAAVNAAAENRKSREFQYEYQVHAAHVQLLEPQ